jgi:hypothetical protein
MIAIHLKNVIDRRSHEIVTLGKKQGMDTINRLSHIGHCNLARMAVEYVERDRGVQRIAQGERLAQQVGGGDFLSWPIPHSPLVYH